MTPLLLIIFNREATTRRLIDRLRAIKPDRIYVAADGPRANAPLDAERCRRCRQVIDEIDWPCEIRRRFSEVNQGCRWGPANALNWFFQQEDAGIILEDDILPDPTFFPFCEEMLKRYASSPGIGCISGYNFLPPVEASYFFSRIPLIWGWATWRDRWQKYDEVCADFDRNFAALSLRPWLSAHDERDIKRKISDCYHDRNPIPTWDFLWTFAVWSEHMIAVLPGHSLTSNIGIGADATHTQTEAPFMLASSQPMRFPLQHPEKISADQRVDRAMFR
jgi:hypothetical protein